MAAIGRSHFPQASQPERFDPARELDQILLQSRDPQDEFSIQLVQALQKGRQDLAALRAQKESVQKIEAFVADTFARVRSEFLVNHSEHPLAASVMRFMSLVEENARSAEVPVSEAALVTQHERYKREFEARLVQLNEKRKRDQATLAMVMQRSRANHAQMMQELEAIRERSSAGLAQEREGRAADQRHFAEQIGALQGNLESMEAAHAASATALQEQIAASSLERQAAVAVIQQTAEAAKQEQAAALAIAQASIQEAQSVNQALSATFQSTAAALQSALSIQQATVTQLSADNASQQKELQRQNAVIDEMNREAQQLREQANRPPTIIYEDSDDCVIM